MIKLTELVNENDLSKVSSILGKSSSDVNKFLKKYDLDADDLLDVIESGDRRRSSLMIMAAMKGNRRALRQLDNLLGFLEENLDENNLKVRKEALYKINYMLRYSQRLGSDEKADLEDLAKIVSKIR